MYRIIHLVAVALRMTVVLLLVTNLASEASTSSSESAHPGMNGLDYACTYVGGSSAEESFPRVGTAVDAAGFVYVTAKITPGDFPPAETPGLREIGLGTDVYVAKLTPDLTTLVACAVVGGSGVDQPDGLKIGSDGNVYVIGNTTSSNFPVSPTAYDTSFGGIGNNPYGSGDVFVMRLSSDLSTLLASTYLGGSGGDAGHDFVFDSEGRLFLTGCTNSSNFPFTPGVYDSTYSPYGPNLQVDCFISCLSADLDSLVLSTFVGGNGDDFGEAVLIADDGSVYVGGWTTGGYPFTFGCAQSYYGGGMFDGFVSRLSADMSTLEASTYVGGSLWDFVYNMVMDADGYVYAGGHTASKGTYPVTTGAYDEEYNGPFGQGTTDDGFLTKFTPDLDSIPASTYIGGTAWDMGFTMLIDDSGYICFSGHTTSDDYPTTDVTFDSTYNGGDADLVFSRFNPELTEMSFSTFLGGNRRDYYPGLDIDASGNIFIGGNTFSTVLATSPNAFDSTYGGSGDIAVLALSGGFFVDTDLDGIVDALDNCPDDPNAGQGDSDTDGFGDACDQCPGFDDLADADGDQTADGCDECTDIDNDGYGDPEFAANTCEEDNCPDVHNPDQTDNDSDGVGNACCCTVVSGNVDADAVGLVDIGDLTRLIDYLYISTEVLACPKSGNVDGDLEGLVDIGDLTGLITYLYVPPNTPPAACQ
jgi:hypothetical protein